MRHSGEVIGRSAAGFSNSRLGLLSPPAASAAGPPELVSHGAGQRRMISPAPANDTTSADRSAVDRGVNVKMAFGR
jgi:hypothetical protein